MRLAPLHVDLSPPLPSSPCPSPDAHGDTPHATRHADGRGSEPQPRFQTRDPFARLLALVTPLRTPHMDTAVPPVPGTGRQGDSRAVTVGRVCKYLRQSGLKETSNAFLAAVAAAAEVRQEALQQREHSTQLSQEAHDSIGKGSRHSDKDVSTAFHGRVMPGQMVLLKNGSLRRHKEPPMSRHDSAKEQAARLQRVRSSVVLPLVRASSVLDATGSGDESVLGVPKSSEEDAVSERDLEDALRCSGGEAGTTFLVAKTVLSERSSKLQSFAAVAFMPTASKKAQVVWSGARQTLKAVQCAREVMTSLGAGGVAGGAESEGLATMDCATSGAKAQSVAAVNEHGALVARLAVGDIVGERALHHGMRGGPVEPPSSLGRPPPLKRSATVIATEQCVILEITARQFQEASDESPVVRPAPLPVSRHPLLHNN